MKQAAMIAAAVVAIAYLMRDRLGGLLNPTDERNIANQAANSFAKGIGLVDENSSIGSTAYDISQNVQKWLFGTPTDSDIINGNTPEAGAANPRGQGQNYGYTESKAGGNAFTPSGQRIAKRAPYTYPLGQTYPVRPSANVGSNNDPLELIPGYVKALSGNRAPDYVRQRPVKRSSTEQGATNTTLPEYIQRPASNGRSK